MGIRKRSRKSTMVIGIILAAVVASSAYGFTAANTVPASKAGDGSGAISGYAVSAVAYTLNATNPQNLDSVAFTLDAAAVTVKARVTTGGTWYNCSNTGGNNWSCTTTAATVAAADNLTVVAVQ